VNNEWKNDYGTTNNTHVNEWNEKEVCISAPALDRSGERLYLSCLRSDGTAEIGQEGGGSHDLEEGTRDTSDDESFVKLMQDALYDFDFNEADVERLLE